MKKLGYTWYPKDWTNSDAVFELTLEQRGLYRELIDLAMLNNNKVKLNFNVWCRRWDIDKLSLGSCLKKLNDLGLIEFSGQINLDEIKGNPLFSVPSCEARLKLIRSGKKGGESKRTDKRTAKQWIKQKEIQIEIKKKLKEKYDMYVYWLQYRKEIKKPITNEKTLKILQDRFGKEDFIKIVEVINYSVENSYRGLFWDKYNEFQGFYKQSSSEIQEKMKKYD